MAFGTYVGIILSKLNKRKFCQAKKCISDILYNIEESEDASSSYTPVYDHQFDRQSLVSTPSSFETFNNFTPSGNISERVNSYCHPAVQYTHSYNCWYNSKMLKFTVLLLLDFSKDPTLQAPFNLPLFHLGHVYLGLLSVQKQNNK